MRVLACCLLVQAGPGGIDESENQTAIQLVESALVLGVEATRRTLQLLAWRAQELIEDDEERPFYALAILFLALGLPEYRMDEPLLLKLGKWVIEEEYRLRQALLATRFPGNRGGWLLNLLGSTQKQEKWQRLATGLLLNPPEPHPPEAAELLQLIGSQLAS